MIALPVNSPAASRMKVMNKKKEDEKKDFVDILLQLQESNKLDFELTRDDLKAIVTVCFLCLSTHAHIFYSLFYFIQD